MFINDNDYLKRKETIEIFQNNDKKMYVIEAVSGIILGLDDLTVLILELTAREISFVTLLKKIQQYLGEHFLNTDDIHATLLDLYIYRLIDIKKNAEKKTIVLINPCYPNKNSLYYSIDSSPPLGLLLIGTILSNQDYNVKIVDMVIQNLREEDILYELSKLKFDYVGISLNFAMSTNPSLKLAKLIKSVYDVPIILGGNQATFMADELLTSQYIDIIVKYQGHDTFLEVIKILEEYGLDSQKLSECQGISFKIDTEVVSTKGGVKIYDINQIPFFDWNLIPLYLYKTSSRWALYTSLGCTNACLYCSTCSFNGSGKVNEMNCETIIGHIRNILKYSLGESIPTITFVDDAFTQNRSRIHDLCKEILRNQMIFSWGCSSRADHVDKELLKIMRQAGCKAMFFGIESCDDQVIKNINKKLVQSDTLTTLKLLKKIGMTITLSFIIGLPGETSESIKLISAFLTQVKPQQARFGFLMLYPGTYYWNNYNKVGLKVLESDYDKYETYIPMVESVTLNKSEMYQALLDLSKTFFKLKLEKE